MSCYCRFPWFENESHFSDHFQLDLKNIHYLFSLSEVVFLSDYIVRSYGLKEMVVTDSVIIERKLCEKICLCKERFL